MIKQVKKVKNPTLFRPMIYSRHPSHNVLRSNTKNIKLLPYRSVIRFGSTTECPDTVAKGGNRIEINTIQAVKNSASKLLMKQKFTEAQVSTAEWVTGNNITDILNNLANHTKDGNVPYPIVAKAHFGSKGRGNTLIKTKEDLDSWVVGKNLSHYIFEKFVNYGHEFRLHVTEDGCFYACRKALKSGVPDSEKWRRHDDICIWFLETSPEFYKPNSWNNIEEDCIKALKAIGADILSFDVKVQTPTDAKGNPRSYQEFILIECNSASSMDNGTGNISICAQKYIEELPKIITRKATR
jgi:hypothetical protein